MKQCPNCQQNYPNDAAPFCAEDGTRLIEVSVADNLGTTMLPTQTSIPQVVGGNLEIKPQSGVFPIVLGIVLGIVAIMLGLIGISAPFINYSLYGFFMIACGLVGLALAVTAAVFGYLARKGQTVLVLGIFASSIFGIMASLIPLGIVTLNDGGQSAYNNFFENIYNESSSTSPTSEHDVNSASNTPHDVAIAFANACQREHYAAVREQMSNSALEGVEKLAKQKNMTSYTLIQETFIKPIKADIDNGGQVQTRNENITGNTATIESTITGRKWSKTKFIIEDGRWKMTNN